MEKKRQFKRKSEQSALSLIKLEVPHVQMHNRALGAVVGCENTLAVMEVGLFSGSKNKILTVRIIYNCSNDF